jgi:hypothetical protein
MNKLILISIATLMAVNADAGLWRRNKQQQSPAPAQQQAPAAPAQQQQEPAQVAGGGVQTIHFDELKIACETPAKYHNQAAPTNIQIGCQDLQLKWVPDTDKELSIKTSRQVTVLAYSDKYNVEAVTSVLESPSQNMTCPRFKQIAEKVESMRAVTCADILAFKGSASDFCAETINAVKSSNPSAAIVSDTGKVVDLCGGSVQQGVTQE